VRGVAEQDQVLERLVPRDRRGFVDEPPQLDAVGDALGHLGDGAEQAGCGGRHDRGVEGGAVPGVGHLGGERLDGTGEILQQGAPRVVPDLLDGRRPRRRRLGETGVASLAALEVEHRPLGDRLHEPEDPRDVVGVDVADHHQVQLLVVGGHLLERAPRLVPERAGAATVDQDMTAVS